MFDFKCVHSHNPHKSPTPHDDVRRCTDLKRVAECGCKDLLCRSGPRVKFANGSRRLTHRSRGRCPQCRKRQPSCVGSMLRSNAAGINKRGTITRQVQTPHFVTLRSATAVAPLFRLCKTMKKKHNETNSTTRLCRRGQRKRKSDFSIHQKCGFSPPRTRLQR